MTSCSDSTARHSLFTEEATLKLHVRTVHSQNPPFASSSVSRFYRLSPPFNLNTSTGAESRRDGKQTKSFLWNIHEKATLQCTFTFSHHIQTALATAEHWSRLSTSQHSLMRRWSAPSKPNGVHCMTLSSLCVFKPTNKTPTQSCPSHRPLQILWGNPHILCDQRKPHNLHVISRYLNNALSPNTEKCRTVCHLWKNVFWRCYCTACPLTTEFPVVCHPPFVLLKRGQAKQSVLLLQALSRSLKHIRSTSIQHWRKWLWLPW